ncbi:secretin N-terminal domain-containing protein [Rhodocyclus purpureus]|uniref:secretin N-terminal domain-containing protein n=1 Tax=Rhodocyclus purpureus TaxID=1067 RepID=UPI0019121732|nr:secretin N-terminal domain-containing protein [Rhodocyclus purpureus]MBK5913801.1 hypothetical protein [Rhodocyclus purpureus]
MKRRSTGQTPQRARARRRALFPLLALGLAACSTLNPPRDTATLQRINDELSQATRPAETSSPLPAAVSDSLLPPLRMPLPKASRRQLEPRFDLVVNDAPIAQVLLGIFADTRYSVLIKPKNVAPGPQTAASTLAAAALPDRLTLNLKDVTLFEALDAIREVYGYDYTVEGNRVYIQQPELQTRLYQVNYISGQRRGVSDIMVVGGASSSTGGTGAGAGGGAGSTVGTTGGSMGGGGGYSGVQASALSTLAKADLWGEIADALRTTLGCEVGRAEGGTATPQTPLGAGGSRRADISYRGEASGATNRGMEGCSDGRALTVHPMSGSILVRGMPNELRMIEKILRSMQVAVERQVIIEAKIIDVELNSGAQQGINWAAFNTANQHRFSVGSNSSLYTATPTSPTNAGGQGGTVTEGTSLSALLGSTLLGVAGGNAFSAGMGVAFQTQNFSALINFLQTQGQVNVLSSPRVATLNNQKAVLKVGREEPFVTNIVGGTVTPSTTAGSPNLVTPPTLTYQPFFSGISLDVTPQIDDKDNITLHIHTMVNSIAEKLKISMPSSDGVPVPFAVNTINESDSVVRTRDGQMIVIGGLMTERTDDTRNKIPGAGDVPVGGALFSKGEQSSQKRELVILLKPTVVKDETAWSDDIAATQQRIENLGSLPPARQ